MEPSKGLSDISKAKFEFQCKVGVSGDICQHIFGDVLLSRIYLESFINKTCLAKSKDITLYGSSGIGKTLIARAICDLLNIQPKIVSDPGIFNDTLGKIEHKIRDLFANARQDQKLYGSDSTLYIIPF